ncbi:methylated-DNA--[protein]-cysteine S-methyltransferase [Aestuariivivens insulae]|uniref:methylated-DNA--[protein]-cysteine S-methyltransferase n=1 Tax=Aestuariivivens insulae TaxID=1621988 RepID=UPI001F57E397|nr:methylated-DNA--[protein]-cysteine S-methyltransferase [Aestuariivivens insulae]
MESCIIETPLGFTKIVGDEDGITEITVLNNLNSPEGGTNNLSFPRKWESEEKTTDIIPVLLEDCVIQLNEYFEGTRQQFNLKLNPQGTDFQKQVWKALEQIPHGKTTTYLELSKQLGDVKAIRAVANANGKNPIWIVIPCHRVIGSDGSLTGYAGGLHRKQWLLDHESPYKQQSLF